MKTLLLKESFVIFKADFFNIIKVSIEHHSTMRWIYQLIQKIKPSFRDHIILMARGNFTEDLLNITKEDRYKKASMDSFNTKWLRKYDSSRCVRFFTWRWDTEIKQELSFDISSMSILDIGCGTGRLLISLAEAGARQLAGTDLAPCMVDLARQHLAEYGIKADIRVADAEDMLPWPEETFDVITLTGTLHHFYLPKDALSEVHRVLRRGGRLIVVDPFFFTPIRQAINFTLLHRKSQDGDFRFYTLCEASKMVASMGFRLSRQQRWVKSFIVTALK